VTQPLAAAVKIGPAQLARIAARAAADPGPWQDLVRYDPASRWYRRLARNDRYEVWLLSWLPGQQTGFHDHGPSAGAFAVALGSLTEQAAVAGRPAPATRTLARGAARSFGQHYVHDVRNDAPEPALSVHAYSPPLSSMRRFGLAADGTLRVTSREWSW
jgi:predicted metal-dependent enzyme (double-stranded beta helix superfamily)